MNTRIKLEVQGLANSQIQSGAYALILAEEEGLRRIPIIVGTAEAQSIAIALEKIAPPRPLTHDLFTALFHSLEIILCEVFIYKFEEGIFFSELVFEQAGKQHKVDSRTSDAIAIALRAGCQIYTTEEIVRECGVVLDASGSIEESLDDDISSELDPESMENKNDLEKWLTLVEDTKLKQKLDDAILKENYEHAQIYKDELRRRKEEEKH